MTRHRQAPPRTLNIEGKPLTIAASPLERLQWLGQVQNDRGLSDVHVSLALMLARHVNAKEGYTWKGSGVFSRLLEIERRAYAYRLSHLVERGHVIVKRQGRHPAAIYLQILPDHYPLDVQHGCTSKPPLDVQFGSISKSDDLSFDVQFGSTSMCNAQKNAVDNSDSYEPRTRNIQGRARRDGRQRAPVVLSPGPSVEDEIIFDDEPPLAPPPPLDASRLRSFAIDELSRPEPPGWREYSESFST